NLARLIAASVGAKAALQDTIRELNGTCGRPGTFDALHGLLEEQAYRLSFWRVAAHELNYRRFFDINDLAGLRMEQPALFHASHALVARLLSEGDIQGLRLDHVDGLCDPKEYFQRLQALADPSWRASTKKDMTTRAHDMHVPQRLYLVVEKILATHESVRSDWPVSGTSGYEFMAAVNGLFVDSRAERFMKRSYMRFIGRPVEFKAVSIDAKRSIMRDTLGSELNVLANLFGRLAKQSRDTRDYSLTALRQALSDVIANFPVYRTYVTGKQTSAEDRRDLDWAVSKARKTAPTSDTSIYDFVRDVLSLQLLHQAPRRYRRRDVIDAALKFQQYTGAVTAKAVEDTAFYRYVCLVSLNEVGGNPDRFGLSPTAFHEMNRRRLSEHPFSMLATATHDHKRGEDVRARLAVLSEIAPDWIAHLRR
ncbi:MAG: malto-oligosyltrehalose synthase, partial [Woeseiaceae bacterium]